MYKTIRVVSLLLLVFVFSSSAAVLEFTATEIGSTPQGDSVFQLDYILSDTTLMANHELAIMFDPSVFIRLEAPVAGPEFDVLLLQPDNPPGVDGVYSLLALVDLPPLERTFSVNAVVGSSLPATLPFEINQLDPVTGMIVAVIVPDGVATRPQGDIVPEPSTFLLSAAGLLVAGTAAACSRRKQAP